MSGTIRNGARLPVTVGYYSGEAGVVEFSGKTEIAFFANNSKAFEPGMSCIIAGESWRVILAESSDPKKGGVAGMVKLTVEREAGE